jgi:hypothetical protein
MTNTEEMPASDETRKARPWDALKLRSPILNLSQRELRDRPDDAPYAHEGKDLTDITPAIEIATERAFI